VAQEGGNIPREKMFSTEHFFADLPDHLHNYLQGWEESLPEAKGVRPGQARDGLGSPAIMADRTPQKRGFIPGHEDRAEKIMHTDPGTTQDPGI